MKFPRLGEGLLIEEWFTIRPWNLIPNPAIHDTIELARDDLSFAPVFHDFLNSWTSQEVGKLLRQWCNR